MNIFKIFLSAILVIGLVSSCKKDVQSNQSNKPTQAAQSGNPTIDNITAKIKKQPNDASLLVARAQAYNRLEGYDEAIFDMNHAIKLDSTKPEYFLFLGDILLNSNRSKDAIQVVNSAVLRFPDHAKCLLKQAEMYHVLKQYHQSTSALNALLVRDPQSAKAYFLFGLNFRELGDTTRAIQSFQKAVDMDPDIIDAWINLGNLWSQKGPSIARKYYQSAISIDTANIYALNSYALFLGNQDHFQESINIYKKIARLDPQYSDGFFNAGIMYLTIDSIELANKQFNLAVKTNPTFAKAYYYRGLTFEQLGQFDQAQADYKQTLAFDPAYQKAIDALQR